MARSKAPSLASQVSKAVVWNTLFVPLRLITEVLATLLKLNRLSLASFGLLALVSGASKVLGTGIDLGTTRALPKYIPETNRVGGALATLRLLQLVFLAQVVVLLAVAAGLAFFQPAFQAYLNGQILGDQRLDLLTQEQLVSFVASYGWLLAATVLALLFFGVCYDMLMAYLSSFFKQRAWNSIDLAAKVLPQLLIVGALLAGWDILGVLAAMVLAPAIAVSLASWQVWRLRRELQREQGTPVPAAPLRAWREWLPPGFVRYSAVSFLMTATDMIASVNFALFLTGDLSDTAVLWAGSALVAMALGYLYTPMVGVQVPLFARVRQGEGGTLNGAYQSLVRLQLLLLVPGGVGLMLLAEPALLVISPQYLVAAPIVWVLVPCLFLECLLTTAHNALIVYERLPIIVVSRLITLLVVIPLAWLLPPIWGLVGVALAFGLARVGAGLWVTGSGMRLLGLCWPWRFTLRVLGATAAMAALILATRGLLPPLPNEAGLGERLIEAGWLFALAGLGAVGFFAALRLLGGLDPADRAQLEKMRLPLKRWLLRMV
ncbi:MAG: polysaccharide biosynthesis C-terminal domain-containing protein [Oscillochloridaceae bacterium umkhey_bin13]